MKTTRSSWSFWLDKKVGHNACARTALAIAVFSLLLLIACGGGTVTSSSAPASAVTAVTVSCTPEQVAVNATSQCTPTVAGTGSYNNSVTWSVSGGGTISSNGVYTAPATAPNPPMVTVTATSVQDTTKSGSFALTVSSPSSITSVTVSCVPAQVQVNETSQCTPAVGGTGNYNSSVTWGVSGGGTISVNGLYSAPATVPYPPNVTVTATSVQDSSKSGNFMLTVTLPPTTYQTSSTDGDGNATFSSPSLTVNLSDIASQLPLAGMNVTLVQQGSQYGLVVVDPTRQYTPRIFFLQGSLGSVISVSLAPLLNGINEISACIAGIEASGQLIPSQCAALTGAMWQFVEQNLMSCNQMELQDIGIQLAADWTTDLLTDQAEDAALTDSATVALLLGQEEIAGVIAVAEVALDGIGAINTAEITFGETQVAAYASPQMGYCLTDLFNVCGVNHSIPGIDLILDDLETVHPLGPPSCGPQSPPQPGTVSGTVTASATGLPLQGAQVLLYGACASTTPTNPSVTTANGTYSFTNVTPSLSCNLSVTQPGYVQGGQLNLSVSSGSTTTVNVSLVVPGIFVANAPSSGPYSITEYAISANGNVSPIATIQGITSGLDIPSGVAIDGNGNIWVTNYAVGGTPSVTEYAPGSNGNTAPIATITGPTTGLLEPVGLAIDSLGNIWVANASGSIAEYAASSKGNVPPIATISGSNTGLTVPGGVVVDPSGNIWVTNEPEAGSLASIIEFAAGSNGNVSPVLTISGGNTGLNYPGGIAIEANGNIWAVNQSQGPPNCPGTTGAITEYAAGSSGNVTPIATISGSNTGLSNPYGLAIYPNGDLWVVNACNSSVTEYAPNSNGNVAPIAVISGSNTGLNAPGGTAGIFPSAVP